MSMYTPQEIDKNYIAYMSEAIASLEMTVDRLTRKGGLEDEEYKTLKYSQRKLLEGQSHLNNYLYYKTITEKEDWDMQ